jgi:hypothetical protein
MNRGAARVGGGATVVELGGSWAERAASYRKGRETSTGKEGKRRQTGPMRVAVVANIAAPSREARKKGWMAFGRRTVMKKMDQGGRRSEQSAQTASPVVWMSTGGWMSEKWLRLCVGSLGRKGLDGR